MASRGVPVKLLRELEVMWGRWGGCCGPEQRSVFGWGSFYKLKFSVTLLGDGQAEQGRYGPDSQGAVGLGLNSCCVGLANGVLGSRLYK